MRPCSNSKIVKIKAVPDAEQPVFLEVTPMTKILEILEQMYPNPKTALNHNSPFELLVATILSAQCTDERVNMITPKLFATYPDAYALAQATRSMDRFIDIFDRKRLQGCGRPSRKT